MTTNKPGWMTTEFWLALVTVLLPLAVQFGVVKSEDSLQVAAQSTTVVQCLAQIIVAVAYIWSRVKIKTKG
jgi:hypothetical protein